MEKVSTSYFMNHGIIETIKLPVGFHACDLPEPESVHNYREFKKENSEAMICYEQADCCLSERDCEVLRQTFAQRPEQGRRQLDFSNGEDGVAKSEEDMAIFSALCRCFVFGGKLVSKGSIIDERLSGWEICSLGSAEREKTIIRGNLRFRDSKGKLEKDRQAVLVIPVSPGAGGSAYLWLQGSEQDLAEYEKDFLLLIAEGSFRELAAAPF